MKLKLSILLLLVFLQVTGKPLSYDSLLQGSWDGENTQSTESVDAIAGWISSDRVKKVDKNFLSHRSFASLNKTIPQFYSLPSVPMTTRFRYTDSPSGLGFLLRI